MPTPSLPSAKVIHVDTRGAVILSEESPETRDSRGIYFPNHIEPVSHIAVDIGGSLAKVVYFTRSPEPPSSPSVIATCGSESPSSLSTPRSPSPSDAQGRLSPPATPASSNLKKNGALTPLVLDPHGGLGKNGLSGLPAGLLRDSYMRRTTQHFPGGSLNFERFETDKIDECVEFIQALIERSAEVNGVSIDEMRKGVKIMATGGGAHRFYDLFRNSLHVDVRREDEMECLIEGLKFITLIPDEVYYFSDELIHSVSNPSSAASSSSSSSSANGKTIPFNDTLVRPSPDPPKYGVIFESNPTPQFPCLLVNIGSGVSIIKVDEDGKFERVSGTSLGGGTLWGLLSLLTPATTFDEMLALSEKGDNSKVDMLVGDIYGQDYSRLGLKSTMIASSFGKVFKKGKNKETFSAEDISKSLLYAVSNNIGQIAYMNAEKYDLDRIYFGGCFIRGHAATIATLSYAIRFWSKGTKRAVFLRHEGFLGSIGAWIKNIEADEYGTAFLKSNGPLLIILPHPLSLPLISIPCPTMSPVHLPAIPPALSAKDKPKKPRHRHSPAQLAALNELFDKDEHPPLELRTHLAEQLGMETKTVNAWFQNKRASSKKRSRAASYSVSHINNFVDTAPQQSQPVSNRYTELFDDFQDDDYPLDNRHPSAPILHSDHYRSSFFTSNSDTPTAYDPDSMPRRLRLRPTVEQTEELKKLYNITQHPSAEQRQILADQIGMRYQSITNWFQNQRSIAKKKRDDDPDASYPSHPDSLSDDRTDYAAYSGLPPPSDHPSLWHNAAYPRNGRRSPSASPSPSDRSPRQRMSSRRSSTPYSSSMPSLSRPRRSRPEPRQLDALKELYTKTSTPSIEERTALALEIGMDVGKVTNWFRNLRQTARKRVKRTRKRRDDDEDGGQGSYSTSASRSGTPSLRSSSPSMDLDPEDDDLHANHSDNGSDDEHQEAVTPPPDTEASPPASAPSSRIAISSLSFSIDSASYAELEKLTATQYSGVKIEDALLLLSFHQHIVH